MAIAQILELISGVLAFPGQVLAIIRILKKTPQENHDDLLKSMAAEADKFAQTGRPTW